MENNNDLHHTENTSIPKPKNECETLHEAIKSRRKFRSLLFHLLYAVDAFNYEVSSREVAGKFNQEYDVDIDLDGQIITIVNSIAQQRDVLDQHLIPFLQNWKFERIGRCTLLVLRYAIWEILNTQTPHSIIINEAVELAKCFSEKDAYKFVNGILDKVSVQKKEKQDSEASNEK